jgi:hypothetical protein
MPSAGTGRRRLWTSDGEGVAHDAAGPRLHPALAPSPCHIPLTRVLSQLGGAVAFGFTYGDISAPWKLPLLIVSFVFVVAGSLAVGHFGVHFGRGGP